MGNNVFSYISRFVCLRPFWNNIGIQSIIFILLHNIFGNVINEVHLDYNNIMDIGNF